MCRPCLCKTNESVLAGEYVCVSVCPHMLLSVRVSVYLCSRVGGLGVHSRTCTQLLITLSRVPGSVPARIPCMRGWRVHLLHCVGVSVCGVCFCVCFHLWLGLFSCVRVCTHTSACFVFTSTLPLVYPHVHLPSWTHTAPGPLPLPEAGRPSPLQSPGERCAVLPSPPLPSAWPSPASALSLSDPLRSLCPHFRPSSSACSPKGAWLCFLAPSACAPQPELYRDPAPPPRVSAGLSSPAWLPRASPPGSPPGTPWPCIFRFAFSFFFLRGM